MTMTWEKVKAIKHTDPFAFALLRRQIDGLFSQMEAQDALLRQAEEALPDPDKLRMLANWLDLDDVRLRRPASAEPMVQDDLRLWASRTRAALQALREHRKER